MSNMLTGRIFSNVDMRNGHRGLAKIAEDNNLIIPKLKRNNFAMFINGDVTAVKIFNDKHEVNHRSPQRLLELDDFIEMLAPTLNQTVEQTRKQWGKPLKNILFNRYEDLEKRYENLEKRRAKTATKKESKRTSSSRK